LLCRKNFSRPLVVYLKNITLKSKADVSFKDLNQEKNALFEAYAMV